MPAHPLEPDDPREIGRYRLTGRLGEGGQGIVYMGVAPDGQRVAVKMLKTTSPEARGRFVREMDAARQVAAFATAAVLDSLVDGRHPYVVSEYVDGPSLQERVAERGPLRGGELDRLMVNTASALTAIHGAGIVHRDLKPANVLLGPDGPRVVDFGIARAVDAETHTAMVGTPSYFAPEWLEGAQPTRASDVFAWAGTMVFAATGHPPFGPTSSVPAIMHRIATAPPDLSGVPDPLHGLLAECLDKDPARRPTARQLLVRLADPSAPADDPRPAGPAMGAPAPQAAPMGGPIGGPPPPPGAAPFDPTMPRSTPQPPGAQPPATPYGPPPATLPAGPPARRGRAPYVALAAAAVVLVAALGVAAWALLNRDSGDPGANRQGDQAGGGSTGQATQGAQSAGPTGQGGQGGQGGQSVPKAFAGTWTGDVTQPSGLASNDTSGVTIALKEGTSGGTASYSTWGCKSSLRVTSSSDSKIEVAEQITGGPVGCTAGTISLTKQGDALRFESQGIGTVTGTLRRG